MKLYDLMLREEVVDGSLVEIKLILFRSEGYLQLKCAGLTNQN